VTEGFDRIDGLRTVKMAFNHARRKTVHRIRRVAIGAQYDIFRPHRHHHGIARLAA
jgi:hypothetical protein